MPKLINATTLVAVATFLWYRKGRLWNFYDSLLSVSIKQIEQGSIDHRRWQEIAQHHRELLSKQTFQSLFRFEVEYLHEKILDVLPNKLWISDSSRTNNGTEVVEIEYTNKERYCRYVISEQFLSDFRFCGLGLFYHALKRHISRKEDTDKGYEEKRRPVSEEEKGKRTNTLTLK
jgi:hypothetical protein